MSIYAICGDPGAGKSAYCVKIAEIHAKGDPRPIFSTFWIDVPGIEVVTWKEMCRLSGAVCIVDESADLFNARDYAKGDNKSQIGLFREHRKDGLTLYLVAQGFDMLDTNIRQMTRYVWHVKRLMGPDFFENESKLERRLGVWSLARMYLAKTFTKESEGAKKRVRLRSQLFRVDALYDRFDTLAKSAGLSGEKDTRGAGLAAGSVLAAERRLARRGAERPRRLPDWVFPLVGVPTPQPRARMQFTKAEYLAWSAPDNLVLGGTAPHDGLMMSGRTAWHGPEKLDTYDRLPEELQVHAVGKTPLTSGE